MNIEPVKNVPFLILTTLKEKFAFPKQPLFGAVSTINMEGPILIPHVRIMRIYDFTEEGQLILLTHTESHKWSEFSHHPHISIAMVSENKLTQIIVNGKLELATIGTSREQAKHYWTMVRPDVKKIYDPSHKIGGPYQNASALQTPSIVPETFGIARITPSFFEILHLDSNYVESDRTQFQLKEGLWHRQRVAVG